VPVAILPAFIAAAYACSFATYSFAGADCQGFAKDQHDNKSLGPPVVVANNYVTQHYDNARTGLNPHETFLTSANVPNLSPLSHKKRLE